MSFEQPNLTPEPSPAENPPVKIESAGFDQAAWEKLKDFSRPADTIFRGRKNGVPPEELEKFAQEHIQLEIDRGNPDYAFDFMYNMKFGTPEQLREVGETAFNLLMSEQKFDRALRTAEAAFGKDSEQFKLAALKLQESIKQAQKKLTRRAAAEAKEIIIKMPPAATMADLFAAIEKVEDDDNFHFDEELLDNFNQDLIDEFNGIKNNPNQAAAVTVADFFKKYDYKPDDLSAFLPIKFSASKKSK